MKQSQKLLLTWLIEDPTIFGAVSKLITPEDFTEDMYRNVAELVFSQYEQEGKPNPAKIISMFEDEETQKEIASIFNARIHEIENKNDREKALKETIIRIRKNSMDVKWANLDPNDILGMMRMIEERKALEKLNQLHISVN